MSSLVRAWIRNWGMALELMELCALVPRPIHCALRFS